MIIAAVTCGESEKSCCADERFEYARKLKQTMEYLREAGEKLCKYELEKRHAIEYEDYERANYKKGQIDDFRSHVYRQCNVEQLLEKNGVRK